MMHMSFHARGQNVTPKMHQIYAFISFSILYKSSWECMVASKSIVSACFAFPHFLARPHHRHDNIGGLKFHLVVITSPRPWDTDMALTAFNSPFSIAKRKLMIGATKSTHLPLTSSKKLLQLRAHRTNEQNLQGNLPLQNQKKVAFMI